MYGHHRKILFNSVTAAENTIMDIEVIDGDTKSDTYARRVKPPRLESLTIKTLHWNVGAKEYSYVSNGNKI